MRSGLAPVLFTAAFGAGLATGLASFWPWPAAVGAAALGLAFRRSDFVVAAGAAVLGMVHGLAGRALHERSCEVRMPPGRVALEFRLSGAATPGIVAAHPVALGCRGDIAILWPAATERPAGSLVRVEGRWIPRTAPGRKATGLFRAETVGPGRGHGSPGARLDGWIVTTSSRLFGPRAPLVDALVLGRRGGIPRDLREGFARSGLVHLLSISGFHVGVLAAWMLVLLRLLRLPRIPAAVTAAALATGYVAFLGWPAPATRAAALTWFAVMALVRQRRLQPVPLITATGLVVMLVDPWAVFDLGAWLSVAAIWGATRFTRWSDAAIGRQGPVRTLFASIGAVLATSPFTAGAFGAVALVGIGLNFAAIPLAGIAVPGIFAALAASAVLPPLAPPLAAGTGLALAGLERLALWGAGVPGGVLVVPTGWRSGVAAGLVVAVGCWIIAPRLRAGHAAARLGWVGAVVIWGQLLVTRNQQPGAGDGYLSLFFLDVGQGDAAAIRTPGGRWLLVDAGPVSRDRDAGREVVAPFLLRNGARSLQALLVSHAHADHLGGAAGTIERVPAAMVVEPAVLAPDSLYLAFLSRLELDRVPWHQGRAGERWQLDGVTFRLLHPDTAWAGWAEDLNEDSLVLLVEYGRFRALFTGDAGFPAEDRLRSRVGRVDVLKAGHHGSRSATGEAWLEELRPAAVVVSVGRNNYGHPNPGTVARIAAAGAALWRTDRQGTVTVRTDGRTVQVSGRSGRQQFEARGAPSGAAPTTSTRRVP